MAECKTAAGQKLLNILQDVFQGLELHVKSLIWYLNGIVYMAYIIFEKLTVFT